MLLKLYHCSRASREDRLTYVAENLLKGSIATEADSQLSWPEPVHSTVVRFASDEDDDLGYDNNEEVTAVVYLYERVSQSGHPSLGAVSTSESWRVNRQLDNALTPYSWSCSVS